MAVLGRLAARAVVISVPELFAEFDAVQGHRRRYTELALRRVLQDASLEIEHMFWWGQWMVPLLKMRPKTESGEAPMAVCRKHLRLPPAPVRAGMWLAYRLEHRLALSGRLRTGASLFAVARAR